MRGKLPFFPNLQLVRYYLAWFKWYTKIRTYACFGKNVNRHLRVSELKDTLKAFEDFRNKQQKCIIIDKFV